MSFRSATSMINSINHMFARPTVADNIGPLRSPPRPTFRGWPNNAPPRRPTSGLASERSNPVGRRWASSSSFGLLPHSRQPRFRRIATDATRGGSCRKTTRLPRLTVIDRTLGGRSRPRVTGQCRGSSDDRRVRPHHRVSENASGRHSRPVQAGRLVGQIATPELDAHLVETEATLLQSKANLLRLQAVGHYAQIEKAVTVPLLVAGSDHPGTVRTEAGRLEIGGCRRRWPCNPTIKVDEADIQRARRRAVVRDADCSI